jgi:hypothetical protein
MRGASVRMGFVSQVAGRHFLEHSPRHGQASSGQAMSALAAGGA